MLLIVILFLLFTSPVFAQSDPTISPTPTPAPAIDLPDTAASQPTDPAFTPTPTPNPIDVLFNQYKTDYLFNYDEYQKAYTVYTEKKQVHTKYGTITTEAEKINATKQALIARNNAIRTYLTALRVKLDKHKTANPTDTEKNQIELRKWESWLFEQNTIVSIINNQNDITKWAQDFKTKWIDIQTALYQALVQHGVNQRHITLQQTSNLASEIQQTGQLDPDSLDWFNRLPILSDQVKEGTNKALQLAVKKQLTNRFTNFYPASKAELIKSDGYLIQIVNNLKSIVIKFSQ